MDTDTEVTHDTDPAPARKGNGHDEKYPCAAHEAGIVENRKIIGEVRNLAQAISKTLGDDIETRTQWQEDVGFALTEQTAAITTLTKRIDDLAEVIGTGPDVSIGSRGTGLRAQVAAAINAATRAGVRREMPSLADADDESEITGVMDRPTLVVAKRAAQRNEAQALEAVRTAHIKAWGGVAVGVIGAIAAALAYLIPLLK